MLDEEARVEKNTAGFVDEEEHDNPRILLRIRIVRMMVESAMLDAKKTRKWTYSIGTCL